VDRGIGLDPERVKTRWSWPNRAGWRLGTMEVCPEVGEMATETTDFDTGAEPSREPERGRREGVATKKAWHFLPFSQQRDYRDLCNAALPRRRFGSKLNVFLGLQLFLAGCAGGVIQTCRTAFAELRRSVEYELGGTATPSI
jgi:hypothetical protein